MGKIFKNKKGFTLIELLAVVVVLAIVGAIAMGAITSVIKNNRIDSFASSANTIYEAAEMACVQDGNISTVKDYVNQKDVDIQEEISKAATSFTITAKGEFSNLSGEDINKRKGKYKGPSDTFDCDASSKPAECTIKYECKPIN